MSENKTSAFHLIMPLAATEKKDTPAKEMDHKSAEKMDLDNKKVLSNTENILNASDSELLPSKKQQAPVSKMEEVDIDEALMNTFASTRQEEISETEDAPIRNTKASLPLQNIDSKLQPIEFSSEEPLFEVPPAIDFNNLPAEDVDEAYRRMMEGSNQVNEEYTAAAQTELSPILFDDGGSSIGEEEDTINILAPISNSSNEAAPQSPESLLPQFRRLQDRDSNFVFLFGRQQAGKTVILSSLAYHMGVDENGVLETRRRTDNLKGAAYLKQLYKSVREGRFMNRTAVGSLYELDLKYTPHQPDTPMNFTFLEMSGEDLTKVELSETSAGQLPSNIDIYLKCPNLNLLFMIVVPYEDASDHDYLVIDFLDYLAERKPNFDFSKVLLLISKWDRYEGTRKDEVDIFVKEQMPRTYSRLKANKGTIARYSIGEVTEDNQFIVNLNQERPETIKRWLYYTITGKRIKDESQSIWNKMKSWF